MNGLLTRARNNLSLSPAERALLKLIEGLACTALVAALPIVADALGHGGANWADVGRATLVAGATAAMLAFIKYFKAYGDPPLPSQP